jgi:glycosyltransferase involved in cell wall biosynthesis
LSNRPSSSRLAVLVPVFGRPEELARTLESVDRQREAFEIIVIDDGSSPPIALDAARFSHPLTILRLDRNRGVAVALNAGVRAALERGFEYLARQDAGDLDLPERIAKQARFLDEHPQVGVVGSWVRFVGPCGETVFDFTPPADDRGIRRWMRYSNPLMHPACMLRTSLLKRYGAYSEDYFGAEDYELFFRLSRGCGLANLPEILVLKSHAPDSISIAQRRRSLWSRARIQWRYFSARSLDSWLGILRSMVMLAMPHGLSVALKRLVTHRGEG